MGSGPSQWVLGVQEADRGTPSLSPPDVPARATPALRARGAREPARHASDAAH